MTVAYAFLGFQTLLVAAVAGMAIMMTARSDPAANPVLLVVTLGLTLALASVFVVLLRRLAISVHALPGMRCHPEERSDEGSALRLVGRSTSAAIDPGFPGLD